MSSAYLRLLVFWYFSWQAFFFFFSPHRRTLLESRENDQDMNEDKNKKKFRHTVYNLGLSGNATLWQFVVSDLHFHFVALLLQLSCFSHPTVRAHRWQPTRLLHPWDSPGKNTGVGCHFLLHLPAILIPACASSSPAFLMMYSSYKLNKQGDNIQPCHTPCPIWNQSVVPYPVLTVAS